MVEGDDIQERAVELLPRAGVVVVQAGGLGALLLGDGPDREPLLEAQAQELEPRQRLGPLRFGPRREQEHSHRVEAVGKELRKMMSFLDAKEVPGS